MYCAQIDAHHKLDIDPIKAIENVLCLSREQDIFKLDNHKSSLCNHSAPSQWTVNQKGGRSLSL